MLLILSIRHQARQELTAGSTQQSKASGSYYINQSLYSGEHACKLHGRLIRLVSVVWKSTSAAKNKVITRKQHVNLQEICRMQESIQPSRQQSRQTVTKSDNIVINSSRRTAAVNYRKSEACIYCTVFKCVSSEPFDHYLRKLQWEVFSDFFVTQVGKALA